MDPDYAARYAELHVRHWWWRARKRFVLDELERRRGWADATVRILDVGCGDGLLFEELSRLGEVEGVEPDASIVTPDGRWSSRIATQPFDETFRPSRRYSRVLFLDVLEHTDEPASMLVHAFRLLEPGGFVLITVPALPALWTSHDELNRHRTRYTRASLARLARDAGAAVDCARYFFHWLVPVKFGVRVKESFAQAQPRIPTIPPRPLNVVLERASRLEQVSVSRLPIPFGTSLLAVLVPGGEAK
jgi:SAM-dependent methyltransferase